MSTDTIAALHATIRELAADGLSERAIIRRLGCTHYQIKRALGRPTGAAGSGRVTDHQPATIEGVTAEQLRDIGTIWQFAIDAQEIVFAKHAAKRQQHIALPDEPVAIAFVSDLHIGAAGADYAAMRADAELIRDTPGMYAVFHGDATDNWIIGKLTALQRGQALGFDAERLLFEAWLDMIAPKLLVWVQGNHDNWSEQLIGSAPNRALIAARRLLFDRHQCVFTLHHCGISRTVVVRHKWRFSSVFNPAHGMMVGWERGDIDYDIAVGGHTHIATLCYPFYKHGRLRHAILTGTYKRIDTFGEEVGFPAPQGRGCGALVFDTDGGQYWFADLASAARYLAYLRRDGV